jgi:hypothetical protein
MATDTSGRKIRGVVQSSSRQQFLGLWSFFVWASFDVGAILDAHYLHRDPKLAASAITKLETRTKT